MLDLTTFISSFRALAVAAESELGTNGVVEAEHITMVNWADMTPPYAVITCSHFEAADWGAFNLAFEFDCILWYVLAVTGVSSGLRTKLETLINAIPSGTAITGGGEVLGITRWSYDDELEVNMILRSANRQYRAGMINFRCVIGETP